MKRGLAMNLAKKLLTSLGLDTRSSEFTYEREPRFGVMASAKVPSAWVKTTCGYCSVGCGMLLGVR
ncbi:MAG TPA: hypothetical protein VMT52_11990, partial [Planctomycetota bacterium]|nr:hypothetical protein [Planctomycetota bacterium]